jgi:magnesium chelatase family protein
VALANNGILFFDELPHFSKITLEALREPLEDHKILVSRVNSKINYPSKFLFVGAQNPCPCGNLLSSIKECRCNDLEIQRYRNKLSDPFLDRIDLHVVMNDTNYEDKALVSSEDIFQKIIAAFKMQKNRGQKELNGKLDEKSIEQFCILDESSQTILNRAISEFSLSLRAINKVLKVSRTIADLEQSKAIEKKHLLDSLSFRYR